MFQNSLKLPFSSVYLISGFLYLALIVSLWLLFSKSIISLFSNPYKKSRFRKKKKNVKRGKLYQHIEMLLSVTLNLKGETYVYTFFIASISLFFIFSLLLRQQSSVAFNVLFSLIFGFLPYGFLNLKLRTIRVEGSYEGEDLVAEILNQYKINYFNMIEAIDKSIIHLKTAPYTQRLLFRLSLQLKEYSNVDELDYILKTFFFGVNTEWIKMLSTNMFLALDDGINVTYGLDDILKELRSAKSTHEQYKRVNSEGFAIVTYLNPLMYIGSVYIATKYFDFTVSKFFTYQLHTASGFKFFVIIICLFLLNIAIMVGFKKKKFDF